MRTKDTDTPSWSTASIEDAADTTPMELSILAEYLHLCRVSHVRVFALHCFLEAIRHFVAARRVTTLLLVGLLIALVIAAGSLML